MILPFFTNFKERWVHGENKQLYPGFRRKTFSWNLSTISITPFLIYRLLWENLSLNIFSRFTFHGHVLVLIFFFLFVSLRLSIVPSRLKSEEFRDPWKSTMVAPLEKGGMLCGVPENLWSTCELYGYLLISMLRLEKLSNDL